MYFKKKFVVAWSSPCNQFTSKKNLLQKIMIERQQDVACGGLLAGRPVKLCVPAACSSRLPSLHPACRAHLKRQHAQGNNGKNYLLLLGPAHVTKKID
jgi:hypothetical protein